MGFDVTSLTTGEKVAVGSGVVTAVAAFLTWVDAGIVTRAGIDGDGVFTLAIGIIVVGIIVFREWGTKEMVATGGLGIVAAAIALNIFMDLGGQTGQQLIEINPGTGLLLTLLGSFGLIVAGGYGLVKERESE